MWRFALRFAIALLALRTPVPQPAPGCVVAGSDLVASLADAQATERCLDIPAGVWHIAPAGGVYLNVTADNLDMRGAGEGKTIIQTQGMTLTSSLVVIQLHGANQHVSDITIQIGGGYAGTAGVGGVGVYTEATYPTIERVEVIGGYSGDGGANGFGMSTYRAWNQGGGAQYATIRDCFIHDGPATGIGINSNNNLVAQNHIERVGASPLTHGIYAQGGYNQYDGNTVIQASGYSFHGWKKVPNLDASGDVWTNNTSINPGVQHMIVSGLANSSNPAFPVGSPLTRFVTVAGNTFRGGNAGLTTDVPATIEGNTFDGVGGAGSPVIQASATSAGSLIVHNRITGGSATNGIQLLSASTAESNQIDSAGISNSIALSGAGALARGNRVSRTGASGSMAGIAIVAAGVRAEDNDISMAGGVCVRIYTISSLNLIRDNVLVATGGAVWILGGDGSGQDRNVLR